MSAKKYILCFDLAIGFLLLVLYLSFSTPKISRLIHGDLENKSNTGFIVKEGDIAPDFSIDINDSTSFVLRDHREEIIVLHFINGSSSYYNDTNYANDEIWAEYNYRNDFTILGIACGMNRKDVENMKSYNSLEYDIAADRTNKIHEKYSNDQTPSGGYVLIGKDGKIIKTYNYSEREELIKKIERVF